MRIIQTNSGKPIASYPATPASTRGSYPAIASKLSRELASIPNVLGTTNRKGGVS